jgi:hypothetical protein
MTEKDFQAIGEDIRAAVARSIGIPVIAHFTRLQPLAYFETLRDPKGTDLVAIYTPTITTVKELHMLVHELGHVVHGHHLSIVRDIFPVSELEAAAEIFALNALSQYGLQALNSDREATMDHIYTLWQEEPESEAEGMFVEAIESGAIPNIPLPWGGRGND